MENKSHDNFKESTSDGGSLANELHSAGLDVSASAFVQRRKQLECRHFERILEEFNDTCEDTATFNGYRVFAVDGTSVNLASDPSADTFMLNSSTPKGYNQLHVTPLYDVLNKTYHDCCIQPQPKQDEISALQSMLLFNYTIPRPSIIVGARGFESYNLFTHLRNVEGMEFLIRVKQEKSAMKLIRDLPMQELDVDVAAKSRHSKPRRTRKRDGFSFRPTQTPAANTAIIPAPVVGIFQVRTPSASVLCGFS